LDILYSPPQTARLCFQRHAPDQITLIMAKGRGHVLVSDMSPMTTANISPPFQKMFTLKSFSCFFWYPEYLMMRLHRPLWITKIACWCQVRLHG